MARLAHSTIRNSFLALSCVLLAFFVVLQISSFENRPKPADAQQGRTNIEATVTQGGPQFKCRPLSYTSSDLVLPLSDPWGTSLRLEPVKWDGGVRTVDDFKVEELTELPDMKEFMKYVHGSKPFVVRGAVEKLGLTSLWTDDYLNSKIGSQTVNVRLSKYKDNVFHYNHNDFASATMRFSELVEKMKSGTGTSYYLAQGNLQWSGRTGQLGLLRADLPKLGFDELLTLKHIQLWFGVGEKKNPMHLDNNENIMLMVSGSKKFRLLSPGQREYAYPIIRSHHSAVSSDANDISNADPEKYPCLHEAKFIDAEVRGGDLFFLPAFWWHQVHSDGRSLAVNFWYDVHSLMLKQMMKTLDLNVALKKSEHEYERQGRW